MVTGGGVGIAQLFYAMVPIFTLGTWIAIVALPLIALGWVYFGVSYVMRTLFSIVLIAGFTDLLKEILKIEPVVHEPILAAIFGGLLIGLGVGLVILGKSSTGGTTVVGEVIAMNSKYKTAEILLFIDALIMFSSIFVYGDVQKSLFSVIGVYVTSRVIDILLSGKPSKKAVDIVSYNPRVLSEQIYEKLGQYGSIVKCTNLKGTKTKTIILIVVDIAKLQYLKEIIAEHDPDAFMIVKEASEFHGRD